MKGSGTLAATAPKENSMLKKFSRSTHGWQRPVVSALANLSGSVKWSISIHSVVNGKAVTASHDSPKKDWWSFILFLSTVDRHCFIIDCVNWVSGMKQNNLQAGQTPGCNNRGQTMSRTRARQKMARSNRQKMTRTRMRSLRSTQSRKTGGPVVMMMMIFACQMRRICLLKTWRPWKSSSIRNEPYFELNGWQAQTHRQTDHGQNTLLFVSDEGPDMNQSDWQTVESI